VGSGRAGRAAQADAAGFRHVASVRREFSAVLEEHFPGRLVTDESLFSTVLDHFLVQHELASGTTVVEEFVAAHPELSDGERDMLPGWRDVVEGTFEIAGKEREAVVLFNLVDELTYRARSNLGRKSFKPLKKGMILVARLVRAGDDWMVSGIRARSRPRPVTACCPPSPSTQ